MHIRPTRGKIGTRKVATPARIAATVVLATCSLASVLTPAALALPSNSIDTYYYSTAAKTKQVGESHLGCQGGFRKSGKITPYYDSYDAPCN